MKVQTVTVQVEFTHNLGNYSNIKPLVTVSALVTEAELVSDVLQVLEMTVLERIDLLVREGEIQHKLRLKQASEQAF